MLDQFTLTTGWHRKAAIRLLRRTGQSKVKKRRGRPRRYSHDEVNVLRVIWEASDRLCSKRLHPFLPELVMVLRRHEEVPVNAETEAQLRQMSPATIDRLLRPYRLVVGGENVTSTPRTSPPFPDKHFNTPFIEASLFTVQHLHGRIGAPSRHC